MTEYQKEAMSAGAQYAGNRCGHLYRQGPRGQLQVYKFGTGWEDAIGRTWADVHRVGPDDFKERQGRAFTGSDLALAGMLAGMLALYFLSVRLF